MDGPAVTRGSVVADGAGRGIVASGALATRGSVFAAAPLVANRAAGRCVVAGRALVADRPVVGGRYRARVAVAGRLAAAALRGRRRRLAADRLRRL
ncbi:hypothetical protein [Amycolatopsis mediterranei]|uniref:hypothetical protein n=1 Tax=Amycolatopsis mediterranei TaxID=33910 RepID=UPI00126A57CB|nr:hypothetical protein [Amycolatopsis mediterranei]UZF75917.1 hypothetical protein ISP_009554 [Amycolatopsis mediterranei]